MGLGQEAAEWMAALAACSTYSGTAHAAIMASVSDVPFAHAHTQLCVRMCDQTFSFTHNCVCACVMKNPTCMPLSTHTFLQVFLGAGAGLPGCEQLKLYTLCGRHT
jgi:hypothetical protein